MHWLEMKKGINHIGQRIILLNCLKTLKNNNPGYKNIKLFMKSLISRDKIKDFQYKKLIGSI